MNYCARALSLVALAATTLLGLSQYRPAWAQRAGLDWWSLPELCEEVRRGEQQLAEMGAQTQGAIERLRTRTKVIEDLRAGRLTLVQAAARFRRLNALTPAGGLDLRGHLVGATEEERLCRQVICWAEAADRPEAPSIAEQTRERLEAELQRLLAKNKGVIRLQE
jgi:hypothetical protein